MASTFHFIGEDIEAELYLSYYLFPNNICQFNQDFIWKAIGGGGGGTHAMGQL